jgi:hypothetical protein
MKFFQKIGVDKYKIMGSDANFKETKQLQKYVHNLFYTEIFANIYFQPYNRRTFMWYKHPRFFWVNPPSIPN